MKNIKFTPKQCLKSLLLISPFIIATAVNAAVTLESSTKIADNGLYFDGEDLDYGNVGTPDTGDKYDFFFGRSISAHGDAVKIYKHYVFMTWYRGGKDDRHVMLTRYNTKTRTSVDIEFPHRHTGFRGDPLVGESHNTIGLAVSPKNGSIHMVYDMHAYTDTNHDGKFKDDYFRYSYSLPGAAEVDDEEFTLKQFVKDTSEVSQGDDDYKHLTMTGDLADKSKFVAFTYPKFFETTDGTLLLYMRWGGNNNGAYFFNKYDAENNTWSNFYQFNHKDQKSHGNAYDWGLYGNMKYLNGKLRVGFQQRSNDNNDKYKYQNGVYYAYSNHPEGLGEWFNHKAEPMTWPLVNSDEIKVFEPGDYITHQQSNSVYIVKDFDWTVTAKGDIHIISLVSTNASSADAKKYGFEGITKEKVAIHSYKPAGADEFVHDTDFVGATSIYTAGDDIYIIGLNNGRPYVERSKGGTSNFERVYTATGGPTFAHGTIYIKNGKVYYYLMERGAGNSLPLHLQVIDLGLPKTTVEFEQSELTVVKGYQTLDITATPSILDPNRSIASVALYINDEIISTLTADPYSWTQDETKLSALEIGTYSIKAVVTDDQGTTAETLMTLNVVDPAPTVAFAESEITLAKGYSAIDIRVNAQTPDVLRTITGVTLSLDDQEVSTVQSDTALHQWTQTSAELMDLDVGVHTLKAVVTDSKGDTAETTMTLNVIDPTPSVSFPAGDIRVDEGYTSLAVNVVAATPVEGRTIQQVELLVNDNPIRTESVAPYDWGHNEANKAELLGFPIGTHTIKAVVTDSAGDTAEATVQLVVSEKVVAPVIRFTQGTQTLFAGFYSDLSFAVEASTAMTTRTIKQVQFTIAGVDTAVVQGSDSGVYEWTSPALQNLTAGTYTVVAEVTDSGDTTAEATLMLTIREPSPPQVTFTSSPSSLIEGYDTISVTINATSPDGSGITGVKIYLNDVEIDSATSVPATFTQSTQALAELTPGRYTLKAVATDERDLSSEVITNVTVSAKPAEKESSGGGSTGLLWLACVSLLALGRRSKS